MALLKRDGGSDVMHAVLNFIAWPRSDCFSHYPHWPTLLQHESHVQLNYSFHVFAQLYLEGLRSFVI